MPIKRELMETNISTPPIQNSSIFDGLLCMHVHRHHREIRAQIFDLQSVLSSAPRSDRRIGLSCTVISDMDIYSCKYLHTDGWTDKVA